jgi:tRNA nucleotidyltransferase (CCA-adding enzyme)
MDLILCHQTADFDALGAAVGLSKLHRGAKIVLTGGSHPSVKDFLALYRDEFPLIERRSVNPKKIRSLFIPDTQQRDRLGLASQWLDLPHLHSIIIYDHHQEAESNIPATQTYIENVGAATTFIVELLREHNIFISPVEATIMALGIHVDTGSLTFEQSTARDAAAIAYLMEHGANVRIISEYVDPSLSPQLQQLLKEGIDNLQQEQWSGYQLATVLLRTQRFVPGLSNLTARLRDLTETDVLLLGHYYQTQNSLELRTQNSELRTNTTPHSLELRTQNSELRTNTTPHSSTPHSLLPTPHSEGRLTIIGRSRLESVDLQELFSEYGGGGHSSASSLTMRCDNPEQVLEEIKEKLKAQIPQPLTARDLMSSPVRTIRPNTTIEQAQRILLRYGHSGLFVCNQEHQLVGVISRRDLDLALHHGFSHAPVKGYMTKNLQIITPDTPLPEIESLMVNNDIGRLPVLENNQLLGIVTRTDVLRQIHQHRISNLSNGNGTKLPSTSCLLPSIKERLNPSLWQILQQAANYAQSQGWHLYLVGGAVRDLLLADEEETLRLQDIDLVVDGFHRAAVTGAGVELAKALREFYPKTRLSVHGDFQTAALLWHKDPNFGSLWIDIATARTEFYPYPAANPEVEASSIRQDLYRRDFTINALALRLTSPHRGELLDFFEGLSDLRSRLVRVLHANSFIEDPTRIYRAVRFAVRLNFELESQTEEYIRYAVKSGVYERISLQKDSIPGLTTRLKAEFSYILQAPYWKRALTLLSDLGALTCLHHNLCLTKELWWQIRCLDRWLKFYDPQRVYTHWLIRLEALIASIPEPDRLKVSTNLELPKDSCERLKNLGKIESIIPQELSQLQRRSEIVELLRKYNPIALILLAVRSNKENRHKIWLYLMHWSKIQAPLNGNDLKELGYKPGRQYKEILSNLLALFLDGKINDKEEAKTFVIKHYQL